MSTESNEKSTRAAEILLIEDNITDVLLTRKAFKELGIEHTITVAKDGDEALAILRREGVHVFAAVPDLILLDLNLPKIEGKDLLAKIKADPHVKHIPVVILTGSLAETDIVKSYDLQAHSYIVKPVNVVQQTFIKDLLEQRVRG